MAESIIEVQHLSKKFHGSENFAVDDISLSIEEGSIFAFLGPNGAGKSTTIKMLTTLLSPTQGSIRINGQDIIKNPNEARQSFGIIFQDPSLDTELTAYENMVIHAVMYAVPKSVYVERIKSLLILVELWDRKDDLVKDFSGGMKRRLEIARGLLHHPRVLFLDEPTVGLDPQTRNLMWSYIAELNKSEKVTIFFTTHYLEEAEKNAQRIEIIDHGKLIAGGTSASLMEDTGTTSLEDAFLKLTGKNIREEAGGTGQMAARAKIWSR